MATKIEESGLKELETLMRQNPHLGEVSAEAEVQFYVERGLNRAQAIETAIEQLRSFRFDVDES